MNKTEAHQLIKSIIPNIRDRNLLEAIIIALQSLAWECAHEKMINSITIEESKDIKGQVNEN
jgi:hypothetical protein